MSLLSTLNEAFSELNESDLDEATMVTPTGKMFPRENVAIILGGGPGSGKGFVTKHNIGIDTKVIDVDKYKDFLARQVNNGRLKELDPEVYNYLKQELETRGYSIETCFRDPKWKKDSNLIEVTHEAVERLGIESSEKSHFGIDARIGHLPNILYDTTGKRPEKIIATSKMFKEKGYHTVYVWVVTDLDVAMSQNKHRARVVKDEIFYDINKKIIKNIPPFLQSSDASVVDECWIFFGGKVNTEKIDDIDWFESHRAVELKKNSDGSFVLDDDLIERIMSAVGDALNYEETEK